MIEGLHITKSKIRQGILILFFTNPRQGYYLRELERMLGYSAGSIRRELLKFQKDGLFDIEKKGNLVYYLLNTKHPLFNELKSIISKTVGVEGSLRKALSSSGGIRSAFIYGSFAAKKEKGASDIDLMVIGDCETSRINEQIAELERKLKREISLTIYSYNEYMAKKREKSGFILNLIKSPKIMLIGDADDL